MINVLVHLLIVVLVCGLLYWAGTAIIGLLPLPDPFGRIAQVILIVIIALILIYALLPLAGGSLSSLSLK
jgi:hypothetical protein